MLSNKDLYDFINNVFTPDKNFLFSSNNNKRSFQFSWLEQFPWLAYSKKYDGAFCLHCVLFGQKTSQIKIFFTKPFKNWCEAMEAFRKHEGSHRKCSKTFSGFHTNSNSSFNTFVAKMSGQSLGYATVEMMDKEFEARFSSAKKGLLSIVDTVAVCARMGIAFRGHDDSSTFHPSPGGYSCERVGNFIKLINFAVRKGDSSLESHLENAPKNATYLSPSSQNEIITCMADCIREDIISDVKNAKYFSIMADACHDLSDKEQMSIVLRYLSPDHSVNKRFLGFVHLTEGMAGQNITDAILSFLNKFGLDVMNCRGQVYGGAGSMAGKVSSSLSSMAQILRNAVDNIHSSWYVQALNLAKKVDIEECYFTHNIL